MKWGSTGIDLSGVALQFFNQISEVISTALQQLTIPAPGTTTTVDKNLLGQTDLIFAYAIDFWTVCVSHTHLQYIYPTPSLRDNITASITSPNPTPVSIPRSATTTTIATAVPSAYFRDYNHLISIVAGLLGDYSIRRAYLLSFSTHEADESDVLEDLNAWDKMVALLNSFSSKPVSDTFPITEETLFTQYLKVCIINFILIPPTLNSSLLLCVFICIYFVFYRKHLRRLD